MDASQCHSVPGLIAVASQLAYHVLHTAGRCEAKEHCANVHTKKTEYAVETDEEEELDEPLAEEESEDEG